CDAIGLNFYANSPRYLSPLKAREIGRGLPLIRVGVFVNEPESKLREIAAIAELDYLQLHGDEAPALIASLKGLRVIRAFRCQNDGLAPIISYLTECEKLNSTPIAILLDAYSPKAFGGTGKVIDWQSIRSLRDQISSEISIILAGGLNPENVAEAIRVSEADGVDTASGVENSSGSKDPDLVARFVKNAKNQFELPG
ncbi:MAG: phosphoribosylanthranilate isomerase, partial [Pirellulaceae bacterium]